jgi:hypothetical protein
MCDSSIQPIAFSIKEKDKLDVPVIGETYKYLLAVIYANKPTRTLENTYFKMFIWEIPEKEINVDLDSLLGSNYPLYSSFIMDNSLDCKDILNEISTEFTMTENSYFGEVDKSNCFEKAKKIIIVNLS